MSSTWKQCHIRQIFPDRPHRYLSSGMEFKDVAMAYRVGIETAREAIHLTCGVLWDRLKDLYMKVSIDNCLE